MRYLALIALLAACGPEYAPDDCQPLADAGAAYEAIWADYEAEYGFSHAECRTVRPVETHVVAQDDFPPHCIAEPGTRLRGCAASEVNTGLMVVWVRECDADPVGVLMHEGLHVLLQCEIGEVPENRDHTGVEWETLGVR